MKTYPELREWLKKNVNRENYRFYNVSKTIAELCVLDTKEKLTAFVEKVKKAGFNVEVDHISSYEGFFYFKFAPTEVKVGS